jgi:hypothetical protein
MDEKEKSCSFKELVETILHVDRESTRWRMEIGVF